MRFPRFFPRRHRVSVEVSGHREMVLFGVDLLTGLADQFESQGETQVPTAFLRALALEQQVTA